MKYSIKVNEVRAKEGSNIKGFATVVYGSTLAESDKFANNIYNICSILNSFNRNSVYHIFNKVSLSNNSLGSLEMESCLNLMQKRCCKSLVCLLCLLR